MSNNISTYRNPLSGITLEAIICGVYRVTETGKYMIAFQINWVDKQGGIQSGLWVVYTNSPDNYSAELRVSNVSVTAGEKLTVTPKLKVGNTIHHPFFMEPTYLQGLISQGKLEVVS